MGEIVPNPNRTCKGTFLQLRGEWRLGIISAMKKNVLLLLTAAFAYAAFPGAQPALKAGEPDVLLRQISKCCIMCNVFLGVLCPKTKNEDKMPFRDEW